MASWRRPSKYFPEHGPASAGGVVRAILAASVLAAMPIKGTRERSRLRAQPLTSPRCRREVCLRDDLLWPKSPSIRLLLTSADRGIGARL